MQCLTGGSLRARRDVTRVGLPPSMVPLEHPCHPWIRCSTFALIPKDLGGFCYVEDIQGRRYLLTCSHVNYLTKLHRSHQPKSELYPDYQKLHWHLGLMTGECFAHLVFV